MVPAPRGDGSGDPGALTAGVGRSCILDVSGCGASAAAEGGGRGGAAIRVPMPKSLPELQHVAAQHFGHGGCLKLLHNGTKLIYHPSQITQIEDGDTITVKHLDGFRTVPAEGTATGNSTARSDYQKHPPAPPRLPVGSDDQSTLTVQSARQRFEGMSRYASDFVRHVNVTPREPCKQTPSMELHTEPTGVTCHQSEFTWRKGEMRENLCDDSKSALTVAAVAAPFEGKSSYNIEYVKHPRVKAELARPAHGFEASAGDASQDFVCQGSTYEADFREFPDFRRQSARPPRTRERPEPFAGSSEYRRQYGEKLVDRPIKQLALESF